MKFGQFSSKLEGNLQLIERCIIWVQVSFSILKYPVWYFLLCPDFSWFLAHLSTFFLSVFPIFLPYSCHGSLIFCLFFPGGADTNLHPVPACPLWLWTDLYRKYSCCLHYLVLHNFPGYTNCFGTGLVKTWINILKIELLWWIIERLHILLQHKICLFDHDGFDALILPLWSKIRCWSKEEVSCIIIRQVHFGQGGGGVFLIQTPIQRYDAEWVTKLMMFPFWVQKLVMGFILKFS